MLLVEDLTKEYPPPRGLQRAFVRGASRHPIEALRGVSFSVGAGEIVGLIGPNGAGKTTLIKVIATLLTPTSGRVSVDGYDVTRHPKETRARMGLVLADDRGLYWRLTGRQNLEFFGRLLGLSPSDAGRRAREVMSLVGLEDTDTLVFGYSSGMRARLNVARAVISDAPLLVLDEPTRSLDPVITAEIHGHLRNLAAKGTTVLLSSHRMDEVATLCDRAVILLDGMVRFDGKPQDLAGDGQRVSAILTDFLVQESAGR